MQAATEQAVYWLNRNVTGHIHSPATRFRSCTMQFFKVCSKNVKIPTRQYMTPSALVLKVYWDKIVKGKVSNGKSNEEKSFCQHVKKISFQIARFSPVDLRDALVIPVKDCQ